MSKEQYRAFCHDRIACSDECQEKIVKAIRSQLTFYPGKYGETRWKNPITGKDEQADLIRICSKYGVDSSLAAYTKEETRKKARSSKRRKEALEQKQENEERIDDSRSSFVFLIWDGKVYADHTRIAPELLPETLTRLTVLAGFLKWEEQYIMRSNDILDPDRKLCSKHARKRDIRSMLQLNAATFDRFWKDATKNGYLSGDEQDGYQLSSIFYRGRLKGCYALRIYTADFRKWYYRGCVGDRDMVDTKNHRRMGKILSLIPYLHMEHNVLCHNRSEKDGSKIKPLNGMDIAKRLGSEPGNWKRDLEDLKKLTLQTKETTQYVFAKNSEQPAIPLGYYVNPNLVYFGKADYFELLRDNPFFRAASEEQAAP